MVIDGVMIKRAMLDPDTGALIRESEQRRDQFAQRLNAMFTLLPSALGVYLDRDAQEALDRASIDELVEQCVSQHRVIVVAQHYDDILRSVARARGVRLATLEHQLRDQEVGKKRLGDQLKALEATLVLTGDLSLDLYVKSAAKLRVVSRWISQVAQRQVSILRISEIAR